MKSGTITFHRTTNYGAVFQTYALQNILLSRGYENEVIDYRSEILEERYKKKNILFYLKPKQFAKVILQNSYIRDNRESFKQFINENIVLSDSIFDASNIKYADSKYEYFIVGSDQVWNGECMGWDGTYLLDFVSDGKKNAYAASFGVNKIDANKIEWYRTKLKDYSRISVREKSGNILLNQLINTEAYTVLDPTLLIKRKKWIELGKRVPNQMNGKYILLYVLKETHEIFDIAKKLAHKWNMPVVYINDRLLRKCGVKNRFYTTPYEWLNLFSNASFVLTNSFHGTAFSLNLNVPFAVQLLPPPSKVNSRITDLLDLCNSNNRIITNVEDVCYDMDFRYINKILDEKRVDSIQFIDSIFEVK